MGTERQRRSAAMGSFSRPPTKIRRWGPVLALTRDRRGFGLGQVRVPALLPECSTFGRVRGPVVDPEGRVSSLQRVARGRGRKAATIRPARGAIRTCLCKCANQDGAFVR
jgi:hypothetical protein